MRLGKAGSGGAGLKNPGNGAARAGRAKPAGALGDLADPDVAVLRPEQLAALRRTLAAVGACAARGPDPVPGHSLASAAAAAAASAAHHSQGSVGEWAGHGAGRQREAAGFGLPAIYQRVPAQVRRTAAGARENTDPNPDPDPVACASKSSRPPAAAAAPAEARAVLAAQKPALPAAPPAAPADAWTIPIATGPASKPAPRAGHAQAASGRVCKPRVCAAGRRVDESNRQAAPAALPVVTAVSATLPASFAVDAAPAAGRCSAEPAPHPDARQTSGSPVESAAAGAGRPEHKRGAGGAHPERDPAPKPPPRPAWLLGGASGSWEAAGRESCVRGTPLWGDLWRGPNPGQAGPNHAEQPLLWGSAGPSVDAGGLHVAVTVRNGHDESPALAGGLAGDGRQELAAHPGAWPCEGGARARAGSPVPAPQGRSAARRGSPPAEARAVRPDPLLCCSDGAEGAPAAGQLPGAGARALPPRSAARPASDLKAGHGSKGAQAHGTGGCGGGAGGSAVAGADLAQDPGGLAQDPGAGEADGATAASGCTAAALAAALAALEREASGDDPLGLGLDTALPPAAGAPGASAGIAHNKAGGERDRGAFVPGSSRGAAGGEAYASLESLEAAVAELAAGLGPADAERLIRRMDLAPAAPDAAAANSEQPDGPAAASARAGCAAAGSRSGRQGSDLLDVLFPEAAGDVQGSGYLAGLETLAESADWGAGAAALDALVDELEALAAAAGGPSRAGCAPASGHGQVRSPGWALHRTAIIPLQHAACMCMDAAKFISMPCSICPAKTLGMRLTQ